MNKSLIFSAPHETTFKNVSPVIDLVKKTYSILYLCQCNYYHETKKICELICNTYDFEVICLKNPLQFKNFYNPSFFHRIFVKVYVRLFLVKKINLASCYIFSPGGLLEGTVAKLIYKQGKKTIMIEGGFPLDLINRKKYKFYQSILIKYFKNHSINKPLKYITKLIVSGEFSKDLRVENGYEENKIADFGVPRNIDLFKNQSYEKSYLFDVIFLTGSFHFHGDYENSNKQKKYVKSLVDYSTSHKIKLLIKVHPRDHENYSKYQNEYVSITHHDLVKNIKLSRVCISFYSSAIYESLVMNTISYFVGQKLNNIWPESDLIIYEQDFSRLKQFLTLSSEKLSEMKQIAYKHISKETIYSAEKINELIENDVN